MLHWIWVLIVGGVIGLIAGAITHKGGSMNWIANIIAGLVGSSLGEALLGAWGPQVAGMAIVPSLLGAIILVILVSWIMTMLFGPRASESYLTQLNNLSQKSSLSRLLFSMVGVLSFHSIIDVI